MEHFGGNRRVACRATERECSVEKETERGGMGVGARVRERV